MRKLASEQTGEKKENAHTGEWANRLRVNNQVSRQLVIKQRVKSIACLYMVTCF